jgi:hypothetical protein
MFGRHFRGACQMDISLSHTGMTALAMMGEPGNLYVEFTPDGLRQMASHLLDAAAKAEAIGAEHARTQLAAALAKREGRPDADLPHARGTASSPRRLSRYAAR